MTEAFLWFSSELAICPEGGTALLRLGRLSDKKPEAYRLNLSRLLVEKQLGCDLHHFSWLAAEHWPEQSLLTMLNSQDYSRESASLGS